MDPKRRALMAERDLALKAGDIARYQMLTMQIAALPLKGTKPLTPADIARYAKAKKGNSNGNRTD